MPTGPDEQRELLRRVEVVAGLDRVTLARLVTHLDSLVVPQGAAVCEQGDRAEALYGPAECRPKRRADLCSRAMAVHNIDFRARPPRP